MRTLKNVMPAEFSKDNGKNAGSAYKHKDEEVVREHSGHRIQWPGTHKNVKFWVELKSGKAVGWNQHPTKGSSFPVINLLKPKN